MPGTLGAAPETNRYAPHTQVVAYLQAGTGDCTLEVVTAASGETVTLLSGGRDRLHFGPAAKGREPGRRRARTLGTTNLFRGRSRGGTCTVKGEP